MSNRNALFRNILATTTHLAQKKRVVAGLPGLPISQQSRVLSLARFFDSRPQSFFDANACDSFLGVLTDLAARHSSSLASYFTSYESELSRAFFFLYEINSLPWHNLSTSDEFRELRFINQEIHPIYLRLQESLLSPFIHLVGFFSRIDRGKSTEGLDLFNAVAEAKGAIPELELRYSNTIRNAIAHGGITFGLSEVEYRDKKGTPLSLSFGEVIREFDDLLDFSNGLALALGAFLLTQPQVRYQIPQQLLLDELRAETLSPWWSIDGCIPSRIAAGKQLIVYAKPNTRDFKKAQFYCFLTAVLAEELAPGFDRYFLSLRSPESPSGFAAFDGLKLRQVREAGPSSFHDYRGVLENDLLFFVPRLKLLRLPGLLDTLRQSFAIRWPFAVAEFRRRLGRPTVHARTATVHRNSFWAILNGTVVLDLGSEEISAAQVKASCHRILTAAFRTAQRSLPLWSLARWLPLGWARVSVFRRDHRKRRLASYGLGPDLICTVQLRRLKRVKAPDILDSRMSRVAVTESHGIGLGLRVFRNQARQSSSLDLLP